METYRQKEKKENPTLQDIITRSEICLGRKLGKTPLSTDSSITYDEFYQDLMAPLFKKSHYKKE